MASAVIDLSDEEKADISWLFEHGVEAFKTNDVEIGFFTHGSFGAEHIHNYTEPPA